MADLVLAKPARFVPRGSAGDDPAVASRWVSGTGKSTQIEGFTEHRHARFEIGQGCSQCCGKKAATAAALLRAADVLSMANIGKGQFPSDHRQRSSNECQCHFRPPVVLESGLTSPSLSADCSDYRQTTGRLERGEIVGC